jgi:two-component system, sensor histidine kinase and response regulator
MLDAIPKILIVDDKAENLLVLEAVLSNLEVEIIKAESGNDALKLTLRHDFALALLDIQMPGMDGYELASILREHKKTAGLPFIFISAVYTDNLNVFKGYERGAFSFITKPFQPEILINKVKLFIEKHQQEIALYKLNLDLEKKNAELVYTNKELEGFAYSVSHDLRAPLRAINGFAQMLYEDYHEELNLDARRLLDVIRGNAKKMGSLIDDLLEFSRLGRKEISKSVLEMTELWQSALNEIKLSTTHHANVIIDPMPAVYADRAMIHQVLINLLANAIKYSSKTEHPVINISSNEKDEVIVFVVTDNGVGFDNLYANKLFGVFQRLHSNAEFEGTGVGLALVKRIVNKHGGEVWATGDLNKGATFSFSLPKAVTNGKIK